MPTFAASERAELPAAPAPVGDAPAAAPVIGVGDMLLQRMAGVVVSSGIGVVRGRLNGGPRWANEAFLTMSGYGRADLAELDWEALAPADFDRLAVAPAGAITPTHEMEFRRKDGSDWPVIVSRGSDPTDANQLILFVVDLTASRVAEAARRAADQRYARFFEISNVAFWTADAQGHATLSSTTTADRLGSDVELAEFEDQAQLVHPDDRAFAIATWEGAVASGEAYDIEVRARGLDGGEYRWTRLQAFPDVEDGVVTSWYGTTEDIHERRMVAEELAESEKRFKRLADDIPVMVWLTDAKFDATYLSKSWYEFTGQTEAEALGRGWLGVVTKEDRERMKPIVGAMERGEAFDLDFRVRAADGSQRWMLSSGRPRFDAAGALVGYAGALTDIHARKMAERELAETQLRLSRALDGTGIGVWEWDGPSDRVSVSGSALNISGIDSIGEEYLPVDYRSAVHPEDRARLLKHMAGVIEGRTAEFACEVRVRRKDGGWVWVLNRGLASTRDAGGRATRMVGTLTNIDENKRAEERLRWTVDHDALTGLASRTLFHRRLDEALATGGAVALALLDIDDFKGVNDVLGHAAGDELLGVLSQRLSDFAGPGETVARLGGDEFTLILPDCGDLETVTARLEELRARLSEPFAHDGQRLTCRSSIGVALAPEHGTDASSLLKSADIAMYSAKASRRGAVALYEPALGAQVRSEAATLTAVRVALDEGRVVPFYEPIVRLYDERVSGFEAVARLIGDEDTLVDVHEFDAVFGEIELSCRLGELVVDKVLADFAAWREQHRAPDFVTVNVSVAELRRGDYAERLLAKLAAHNIPPARLRIEIVEPGLSNGRGSTDGALGVLSRSVASSEATLATLSRGGVLAALDRFGVGAASLSQLSRLPLAAVKIDRQLVRNVASGRKDRTLVEAIAGLGRSFGVRVVALGVETADQAGVLTDLGCTYGQGSYFGESADAATALARLP